MRSAAVKRGGRGVRFPTVARWHPVTDPLSDCSDRRVVRPSAPSPTWFGPESPHERTTTLRQTRKVHWSIFTPEGATGPGGIEEGIVTATQIQQNRVAPMAPPARSGSMLRRALLMSGIISSLLYLATDLLGGLRYEGYSFASQAISELGAIGAPSKPLVDPLFLLYDALALAFGVGVVREAARRNRALRTAGTALMGYGATGFAAIAIAGPTFFAMHQRGTGSLASDSPHIILTGVLVLFLLLAIGVGAFAFGQGFRIYSFATLVVVIVFGALGGSYGARLAAGQATPGFGILERINVYASMLWIVMLAILLLRRRDTAAQPPLP